MNFKCEYVVFKEEKGVGQKRRIYCGIFDEKEEAQKYITKNNKREAEENIEYFSEVITIGNTGTKNKEMKTELKIGDYIIYKMRLDPENRKRIYKIIDISPNSGNIISQSSLGNEYIDKPSKFQLATEKEIIEASIKNIFVNKTKKDVEKNK